MDFGKTIKMLREAHDMSQRELAEKMHLTRSVISKWENGKRYPNYQEIIELRQLFNVSFDSLLSDVSSEEDNKTVPNLSDQKEDLILAVAIFIICIIVLIFSLAEYLQTLGNSNLNINPIFTVIINILIVFFSGYFMYKSTKNEATKTDICLLLVLLYAKYAIRLAFSSNYQVLVQLNNSLWLNISFSTVILICLLYYFQKAKYKKPGIAIVICCIQIQLLLFMYSQIMWNLLSNHLLFSTMHIYISIELIQYLLLFSILIIKINFFGRKIDV